MATPSFEASTRAALGAEIAADAGSPSEGSTPSEAPSQGDGGAPPESAVAQPQDDPAGRTPSGQPQAPEAEPTPSAYQSLLSRYENDPERAAREFFALEHRISEMARQAKAQPAPTPAPAVPAPITQPPVAAPVPPVQAQPAAAIPDDAQIEAYVDQVEVFRDPECVAYVSEYKGNNERLSQIVSPNGEMAKVERAIYDQSLLADPERIKGLGLEVDEFQIHNAKLRLQELRSQRIELRSEVQGLQQRNTLLGTAFDQRRGLYLQRYKQQYDGQRHEASEAAALDAEAGNFQSEWMQTFKLVSTAEKVAPEDLADIDEAVRESAKAALIDPNFVIEKGKLWGFMQGVIRREVKRRDDYYRRRQAEYGKLKNADARQPAPPGKSAVAPAHPTEHPDFEKALKAQLRAELPDRNA